MDDFDGFKERMFGDNNKKNPRHKRALLFVDNSGADIVLGMLPLARELLRRGTEVSWLPIFWTFVLDCKRFFSILNPLSIILSLVIIIIITIWFEFQLLLLIMNVLFTKDVLVILRFIGRYPGLKCEMWNLPAFWCGFFMNIVISFFM